MPILVSDSFSGATGAIASRQLNFDLGGSAGTILWKSDGASADTSNSVLVPVGNIGMSVHVASADYVIAKFTVIGQAQGIVYGRGSASATGVNYDSSYAALFVGSTDFRIRRFDSAAASLGDVVTTTHSVFSANGQHAIQLGYNGSAISASILSSALVTALTINFEASAGGIPTGTAWGVREYFGASALHVDDFIVGAYDAAPPPPTNNVYPYNPLGNLVVDLGGLRYY